jgi:hypothetical protein
MTSKTPRGKREIGDGLNAFHPATLGETYPRGPGGEQGRWQLDGGQTACESSRPLPDPGIGEGLANETCQVGVPGHSSRRHVGGVCVHFAVRD